MSTLQKRIVVQFVLQYANVHRELVDFNIFFQEDKGQFNVLVLKLKSVKSGSIHNVG